MIKILLVISMFGLPTDTMSHLIDAEKEMLLGNCRGAIKHIELAIGTGYLSYHISASAYWNAYVCCDSVGDEDGMAKSLFGFVVHFYNSGRTYSNLSDENKNTILRWMTDNGMDRKYQIANVIIHSLWAKRNDYSCRKKQFSCPIYSKRDIIIYAKKIPFCSSDTDDMKIYRSGDSYMLSVNCDGVIEKYYFGLIK